MFRVLLKLPQVNREHRQEWLNISLVIPRQEEVYDFVNMIKSVEFMEIAIGTEQ